MNQLAQIASEAYPFAQYGVIGVVLGWFMWRDEKRANDSKVRDERISTDYRALGHRIDGLSKALLVDMTERESCGLHVKRYAREEIAKIDARMPRE